MYLLTWLWAPAHHYQTDPIGKLFLKINIKRCVGFLNLGTNSLDTIGKSLLFTKNVCDQAGIYHDK